MDPVEQHQSMAWWKPILPLSVLRHRQMGGFEKERLMSSRRMPLARSNGIQW